MGVDSPVIGRSGSTMIIAIPSLPLWSRGGTAVPGRRPVLVDLLEQDDPSPSATGRAASALSRALADDARHQTARRHASSQSGQ